MKCFSYLTSVALVSMGIFTMSSCSQSASEKTEAVPVNDAVSAIMSRTSIRAYQDKPVEDEKVDKLLRAAMAAPTAVNRQPWHFVVVNDKDVLTKLSATNPHGDMIAKAPLAFVVCGDMNKALEGDGRDFWIQDASAATENLLVAANALGLGAVWTGVYPAKDRVDAVSKVLNLPANLIPLCVVPVGYPAESPKPKDKYLAENISYNVMGDSVAASKAVKKELELTNFDVQQGFGYNPFTLFSKDWMLLAAGNKDKFNAMTIGWGQLGNIWGMERNVVTVYVRENRYTYKFMEKSKYFTVAAFPDYYRDKLQYMGTHSGRDEDKIKATGLQVEFTKLGNPLFTEAKLVLECKKIYEAPFNRSRIDKDAATAYKDDTTMHVMYIGEIVNAWKR